MGKSNKLLHGTFLIIFIMVFIWYSISPMDRFTWFLEVIPAIIGFIVVILTYKQFKLTNIVYILILIHAIILIIGGHYTYAEMPFFNWLRDTFSLERNYYDRLGHFAQGFIPAIVSREILLRKSILKRGKMLNFIIICICLAISATYELIEWGVAEATETAAEAFLGTQGDVWDTQWDMFLALVGSIVALVSLSKIHDSFLRKLGYTK
ncbi:DUF2238 domain-containing protein [Clostridium botulinum]|uniref:DUF2238 domain-containing protein n=1 Tax=Clostridium botulinum TaxID=1491 RepID=UPI0004D84ED3|nr:DUF2238 domain-containing protein [Clostridium botulinum]KEI04251.1 membrane protein [Clostridium botulinum C/D str. BKT75002]KEI12245.1 membrane protein [Clostridium botulinum C/D str. BKT2873]MCD3351887.1 DUF2238 domain-containing protein [Clostridium botulinum D/C]MCD3360834.1 DUF2238 domain-containing protein [Clostridium botulinum D/C]MCD3363625.1 DUF2238 domain-containing protein [Clostridium botulinum D/C]